MRKVMVVGFTLSTLIFVLCATLVHADSWSALNSGYAITTDWHGANVPLGATVTATAGTVDPSVTSVTFRWMAPNGEEFWDMEVSVVTDGGLGEWEGETIYYAESFLTINGASTGLSTDEMLGDWGVQAWFYTPGGHLKGHSSCILKIRATSFMVIPEAGTLAVMLSMLGSLGIFLRKRETS